eukprot:GHVP01011844.1.p1 GENE.GHVP01011844.1~~GHVP01011844.1.p1  ORF type:complete len:163 (+),score=23.55 GHVP01011844.1:58-489(+)
MPRRDRSPTVSDTSEKVRDPLGVFRKITHVGKPPEKFQFELLIEAVRVKFPRDVEISADWVRGPKIVRSKERLKLNLKEGKSKCGFVAFEEPIRLVATLFVSSTNNDEKTYNSKLSKLQIVEVGDKNMRNPIGKFYFKFLYKR